MMFKHNCLTLINIALPVTIAIACVGCSNPERTDSDVDEALIAPPSNITAEDLQAEDAPQSLRALERDNKTETE